MKQPRIRPLALPLAGGIQELMDRIFPRGAPSPELYRTVARNEGLFRDMVERRFIGPTGLFDRKTIPPRLRELIILRTCVKAGNDYEFALHTETISRAMGLGAEQIEDIKNGRPHAPLWEKGEPELMDLIDSLVDEIAVADEVFAAAGRHFDEPMLIEITNLVGLYTGVAMIVALARPKFDNYRDMLKGSGNKPVHKGEERP